MSITLELKNGIPVVSVLESLDSASISKFEEMSRETIPNQRKIVIDFTRLEKISSAGLRACLQILLMCFAQDISVAICVPTKETNVRHTIETVGLDIIMPIYGTLDEALSVIDARPRTQLNRTKNSLIVDLIQRSEEIGGRNEKPRKV